MTLPRTLPAGLSLPVILIPRPLRGRKEKFELYVAMLLDEPLPEPPELNDIFPRGMIMNPPFGPPKPTDRRNKIFIYGKPGTGKSLAGLSFPKAYYLDNHGSVEKYRTAYPDHLFAEPVKSDDVMNAVVYALEHPGDRRTFVLDDITVYEERLYIKWSKLFLMRQPGGKGDHKEFYTLQPSDYMHPKREEKTLIRRLLLMDLDVIMIGRAAKEYTSDGKDFMKPTGKDTFSGEKGLPHEFDFVFEFVLEEDGKRYAITKIKQRQTPGVPLFPDKFEFHIDAQGNSDFYAVFSQLGGGAVVREAHQVVDPEKTEAFPPETSVEAPVLASLGTSPGSLADMETLAALTSPAGSSAVASGSGTAAPPSGLILPEQLEKLVALKAEYKIANEEWGKTLQKFYGVITAKALTTEQATHFINYLSTERVPF